MNSKNQNDVNKPHRNRKYLIYIRDMTVFAMLAAIMFGSRIAMAALPNIHLLGMLVMLSTVVYRFKALIPIYLYVILEGIYGGFALWWIPYLYIWTLLWGATMLIPKNIGNKWAMFVYPIVCGLHGLLYGTLYAPVQAIMFHLNFDGMKAWIIAGLPYDAIHAISNVAFGTLVLPLSKVLKKLNR